MDYLLEPGMDPTIEGALDRGNELVLSSVEGRWAATVSPIIQIIVVGTVNVITGTASFPNPEDMVPSCMNAIRAAEGTRAEASGYIFVGPSSSVTAYPRFPVGLNNDVIVGLAVDRNSWGKIIVTEIARNSDNLLVVTGSTEYDGHGILTGTIFDPWGEE